MATATIMHSGSVERRAEQHLSVRFGVMRLLPHLWEMVVAEARVLPGLDTPRAFARRYLDYLRDYSRRASDVDVD